MARKKKSKSGGRRRRRVSGIGSATVMPIIGGLAGMVVSKMVGNALGSKVDPKIVAGAQIAAGIFLIPKFLKGPFGSGLAIGVGAAGGAALLQSTGLIGSVADFYRIPTINGMRKVSGSAQQALAGSAQQMLSGVDLVTKSADVREYTPNYNFATSGNQLNVISGCPSEYDECHFEGY